MKPQYCRIAAALGRRAAHGRPLSDHPADAPSTYDTFEPVLAAWGASDPTLRGDGINLLIWIWEQARRHEIAAINLAIHRIQRATKPLFQITAPREQILVAAETANNNILCNQELATELGMILNTSRRKPR